MSYIDNKTRGRNRTAVIRNRYKAAVFIIVGGFLLVGVTVGRNNYNIARALGFGQVIFVLACGILPFNQLVVREDVFDRDLRPCTVG